MSGKSRRRKSVKPKVRFDFESLPMLSARDFGTPDTWSFSRSPLRLQTFDGEEIYEGDKLVSVMVKRKPRTK